jgi:lysophospholipase L1-like esterase
MSRLGSWMAGAALLLVAGAAQAAPIAAGSTYVALGSSYAAGPGITTQAADSPGRCGQSADNYPRQLAAKLQLRLVDRSCGGATTNDVRYMAGFGAAVCRARPDPARPCAADPPGFDLRQAFAATKASLRAIAAQVRRRAPRARLVFVDYVTVLPAQGACATVAISAADAGALRARADRLAKLTAQVAAEAHADILKASDLTRGHDACSAEPWVEGLVQGQTPAGRTRASFHPTLPAMTAIAAALAQRLAN